MLAFTLCSVFKKLLFSSVGSNITFFSDSENLPQRVAEDSLILHMFHFTNEHRSSAGLRVAPTCLHTLQLV